ncbi:MAG TPA: DNA ligase, partial [Burkholderiaceae bacterium]|nr:DNA ligase [Burkholderiaceae bacterium]
LTLLAATAPWPAAHAAAPALPLLGVWSDVLDPARYLVSEKYDGVRGVWDGMTLRFRSGRVVPAPAWFTAQLPRVPLDGELWLGRGRFDEVSGIVRKAVPVDAEWRRLRYMVFELPGAPGSFAERATRIEAIVGRSAAPALVAVRQTTLGDRAALQRALAATIAQGGEGLVLHLASAPASIGRSDAILKLKPSLDAEATVIGHRAGKGKYEGLLGALELRTPQGRRFLIGSGLSDALRREPPAIGSVVTYRYRDPTGTGLPRFASFMRVHDAL